MLSELHITQCTQSTNDDVRAYVDATQDTSRVYVARCQKAGRGQWQRRWESPYGGLYFSFACSPKVSSQEWPGLSVAFAQALVSALNSFLLVPHKSLWIKKPNDIVCEEGKLCGISLESKAGIIVVGVGINVFHPTEDIVTDGRNIPAYLQDMSATPLMTRFASENSALNALLWQCIDACNSVCAQWCE